MRSGLARWAMIWQVQCPRDRLYQEILQSEGQACWRQQEGKLTARLEWPREPVAFSTGYHGWLQERGRSQEKVGQGQVVGKGKNNESYWPIWPKIGQGTAGQNPA